MNLLYHGRVVIITGAGGSIGREYALEFAKRGAAVVVNDLGGDSHGAQSSRNAANQVVEEIRNAGGKAIADYNSVEQGKDIVQTAIKNFGRIDVVVNNAGIIRDKSFAKMNELDWDLVQRVHVKGAFSLTHAAWPYFRQQKYGRLIFTSSNSGICGNFGQANYAAAKCALIGFSNTLAVEGAKYGIMSNVIVPTASSRLLDGLLPEDLLRKLHPRFIVPLVVYLCHEKCHVTGGLFEAAAGYYRQVQSMRSRGIFIKDVKDATAEKIADNWNQITDMSDAVHFGNFQEATMSLLTDKVDSKPPSVVPKNPAKSPLTLEPSAILQELNETLKAMPQLVQSWPQPIRFLIKNRRGEDYVFILHALKETKDEHSSRLDATRETDDTSMYNFSMDEEILRELFLGKVTLKKAILSGDVKFTGNESSVEWLQKLIDSSRNPRL